MHTPPQTGTPAKPLRGLFVLLVGFLVLSYLIAVVWHWSDTRRDAENQLRYINSILVQNTRTTLKNYELVLKSAGNELVAAGALETPAHGRLLIDRLEAADPGMAGFGLARTDGQLVLVSSVPVGASLPNLLQQAETRDSFLASVETGQLQIGRPYYMQPLRQWVIPVRAPIVDTRGRTVAVMTAGYRLSGGGSTLLANAVLPPGVMTGLLRDDGYVQYLHPVPGNLRTQALQDTFGRTVAPETRRQLSALTTEKGVTSIRFPRLHNRFLLVYERIPEYGLLSGAFIPWPLVVLEWLQRLVLPTALLVVFLVGAAWAYRRALARQAEASDAVSRLAGWRQAVLDAAEYSIISTDTAGTIVSFNAAAQRMLGYRADEVVGLITPSVFHDPGEVRQRAQELTAEFSTLVSPGFDVFVARARRGEAEEREWTYVRKDGTRFPVRLSVTPLHGPDGRVEGFLGIAADLSEHAQARASMRDSEARYRTLFEHAGDSIFLMKGELFVDCNPATLDMFGCTRKDIVGTTPYRFSPEFQPDGQASRDKAIALITAACDGRTQCFEWRHTRLDGSPFDTEVTLNSVMIGGESHILATVRDTTQRKQVELELTQSRQALVERNDNLRLINQLSNRIHASLELDDILREAMEALQGLSHAPNVAVYLLEPDGSALRLAASRGFSADFLHLTENIPLTGSLCGMAISDRRAYICDDLATDTRIQPHLRDTLAAAGLRTGIVIPMIYHERVLGSLNVVYPEHHCFGESELDTLNAFGNTVALAIANARHVVSLAFQARYDSLTTLPNRAVLHAEFGERVARAPGAVTALMLLDLDRFKEVNDTLGHHVGDMLLTQIGPRIEQGLAGRQALVCRLGGDEFAILLTSAASRDEAADLARRVSESLRQPFLIQGVALQIGASIGVTFHPEHGANSHDLLRAADVAMYQAKKLGTGVVVYDRSFDTYSPEKLALATELAHAVEGGELVLHYQPKLDLVSRRVTGFEALVRWRNPRLGLLYPASFVHLAEMNEVVHPFTHAILNLALADKLRLRALGYLQPVAINLSARNLLDSRFALHLREAIDRHGVPYGEIELELTETALMQDPDSSTAILRGLADLGIAIAVDDFGTGYSSLAYLRRLPLKALKIDRSFVTSMRENTQDAIIVRSTVALAHNLGLGVIAEGVEDARTLEALREIGCDQAQGYYLSRPLPLDELIAWLHQEALETV